MMVHESISMSINHRDASDSTSARLWRKPPTPISVPGANDRFQRPQPNLYARAANPTFGIQDCAATGQPLRPHDNPYGRMANNNLRNRNRPPGNPNVRQTVLGVPPDEDISVSSRARKRPKLDSSFPSYPMSNGASSSYAKGPAPRSSVSQPGIQAIELPRSANSRTISVPNDAEIIDLGASSDDLGERVLRAFKSSSPDPLLIPPPRHPFDIRPTEYSSSNKGKARVKEPPEYVEGSEEEDEIKEFTPPPSVGRPSSVNQVIPANIVYQRRQVFEGPPVSAPAAIRRPAGEGVVSVDLRDGTVVGKMRRKDEGASVHQKNISFDRVGTSSSNFTNSARRMERIQLPLEAWCLGQHHFKHSESAPLTLAYDVTLHRIKVTWGGPPPEKIEFQIDRDTYKAMIVNDLEEPLKHNVVIQFNATSGLTWKEVERKYKGFKAGEARGKDIITFLFSTAKDRDFSTTGYQQFVTRIRKAFKPSLVEIIKPPKGAAVWAYATQLAAMLELTDTGNGKEDCGKSIPDELLARSVTPCSLTSVKTGPELKPSNGDPGPSTTIRRSARQSAVRSLRASPPPPPPAVLEPDEVVLMYPPTGTGALSIMQSDLRRLQPEEYLNDTLIEFGLKLWLSDLREKDPGLAEQIHVFSSFFYKKLNNRKNPEEGYKSVRKWTSKVSLFTKKYIIVPINENVHWYLAIIYEPGRTLEPPLPLSQLQLSNSRMTRKQKRTHERAKAHSETLTEVSPAQATEGEPEADTSSMGATRATTPSVAENEEMDDAAITVFDRSCSISAACPTSSETQIRDSSPDLVHPPSDSMDIDADTSVTDVAPNITCEIRGPSTSEPPSAIPVSQFYGSMDQQGDVQSVVIEDHEDSGEDQRQEAEVVDMLAVAQSSTNDTLPQTYIFTLDSLGTRHPQAIKVLKNYLKLEAKDKHNFDEVRDAVGKQVQVPVQPNTWDCGIYLLHFVKVFMRSPMEFVEQILSTRGTMQSSDRKKMWQDHEVPRSRDYLQSRIIQLSDEWKAVREGVVNKRRSGDALEIEAVSSEGEVDIVEDIPSAKATPGPKQKQPAMRLRG